MKTCQICNNKAQHKHHIISKSNGGKNTKDNICYLCASCHHEVHHTGSIVIEGNFMTTSGYQLIWHKQNEDSITGSNPHLYKTY